VIVIGPSHIHPSLRRHASLSHYWNGGTVDSVRMQTLFLGEETSSRTNCVDGDTYLSPPSFSFSSMSKLPSRVNDLRHTRRESASVRASNDSAGASGLLLVASGRKSLLDSPHVSESERPHCMAASPIELPFNYQTNLIPEARIPLPDDTLLPITIPVRQAQCPTDLSEPQLMIATSSGGKSSSHRSLKSIGEYSRRIVGNISRRDRVVAWRKRLARSAGSASHDDLRVSDTSGDGADEAVHNNKGSRDRQEVWKTLVSLLDFKHRTSAGSIPNDVEPSIVSTTSISSSSSKCTAVSVPSSLLDVISSPVPSSGAVNESTSDTTPTPPETASASCPVSDSSVKPASETEGPVCTLARSVGDVLISNLVIEPLPQSPTADTCMPIGSASSETPIAVCAPTNTQGAVTNDKPSSDGSGALFAVSASAGSSSTSGSQGVIHSDMDLTFPSPSTATSVRSDSMFVALVEELQSQHQHGQAYPTCSAVAIGLVKRDPLAYKRAGITGKARFSKFIGFAVQAGVVTIGGDIGEQWVSLNPAWREILTASNDVASIATNAHADVQTSPPLVARSLSAGASTLNQNLPPGFRLLVQRLQRLQSKDVPQPYRSLVAIDLVMQDKLVYEKVGVENFDAYAALAVEAGIVKLGGEGPRAWISLSV
jgi:hypothetical protein